MLLSLNLPEMAIQWSSEPVAELFFPGKKRKYYKIKAYGKFFIVKNRGFRGIFEMRDEYVSYIGKTAVYSYHITNNTPLDLTLVNEVNRFARTNQLSKVKRQHARQSNLLRGLKLKNRKEQDIMDEANRVSLEESKKLEDALAEGREKMNEEIDTMNKEKDEEEKVSPTAKHESYYLLDYLNDKKLLNLKEKESLEHKVLSGGMSLDDLITELKEFHVLTIHTPMDLKTQEFLEEFGDEDPERLINFVDRLSDIDKKQKNMTAVPAKSWIPGSIIWALMIGAPIGIAILAAAWPTISAGFTGHQVDPKSNPLNGLTGMFQPKPGGMSFWAWKLAMNLGL